MLDSNLLQIMSKLNIVSDQSPTGHLNQNTEDIERQPLLLVSQSLQIFHKIYRNFSRRGPSTG